ncbi:MAG: hypothetical protein IJJ70_08355 [Treponema sp.]|nr:hypothetical protein [Treponema sp.]MBR0487696.1 hypothetical protein [Treponema sp.]
MKKITSLLAVFVTLTGLASADIGLGGAFGFDLGFDTPVFAAATVRFDTMPWVLYANYYSSEARVDAVADNWFINEHLTGVLDWYAFWGISASTGFADGFELTTGARIGAGLDWFILDQRQLEFFVQAAYNPRIGVNFDDGFAFVPLCFPLSTGARWWFR